MKNAEAQSRPTTAWPLRWLLIAAALSIVVTSFGSALDGNNHIRIAFTGGLVVMAALRYAIAAWRREHGKTWILYAGVLVLGPVLWMAAEYLYTIGTWFDRHPAP